MFWLQSRCNCECYSYCNKKSLFRVNLARSTALLYWQVRGTNSLVLGRPWTLWLLIDLSQLLTTAVFLPVNRQRAEVWRWDCLAEECPGQPERLCPAPHPGGFPGGCQRVPGGHGPVQHSPEVKHLSLQRVRTNTHQLHWVKRWAADWLGWESQVALYHSPLK